MLVLTENAVEAIGALKASSESIPDAAGLRIAAHEGAEAETALELAIVPSPDDGDVVVEASGQQVFLEPLAATLLDDKILDAQVSEGRVRFAVGVQGGSGLDGTDPGA